MRKAVVTIRRVRRQTDYDIGVTGARIGHVYFRFNDINHLRIKRRFFIGRKTVVLSTDSIDYRILASTDNIDNYIDALASAWSKYRGIKWNNKFV